MKNNEKINTTALACSRGWIDNDSTSLNSGSLNLEEFNCDRLLIFATASPIENINSNITNHILTYAHDLYIYKVNNALSNGISGSLVSCGMSYHMGWSDQNSKEIIEISSIPCRDVFIAYEIPF